MAAPLLTKASQERTEDESVAEGSAAARGRQESLQTQTVLELRWLTPGC